MTGKGQRMLAVSLVTLGFCVPVAAMSGTARAAGGKCQ
jgi:hypothetical protein